MLKAERQSEILKILAKDHRVITSELTSVFDVSEDTIRRDIIELDSKGLLKRVHSGATRIGPPITDFTYRESVDTEEKTIMAKKALDLLKEDSVILIDGSTSNLFLVRNIPLDFRASIITNSPPIAIALSQHKNIDVINIGGEYYKRSMINVGVEAYKEISQMRANLYIMGVYNIDLENGTSVPTKAEADIKSIMMEISEEVLSMVTPDKFENKSNHIVCGANDITYLISTDLDENIKEEYQKRGIELL